MNSNLGEPSNIIKTVGTVNSSKCLDTSSLSPYSNNNLDLMSTEKTSFEVSSLSSPSSSTSSSSSLTDYNKNNNNYDEKEKRAPSTQAVSTEEGEAKEHHQIRHHRASKSPTTTNQHVAFCNYIDDEPEEKRKKYLTAKYGQHQMALIKKRLQVEMWLYEKLQDLCNIQNPYNDDLVDVDLDLLLDIADDQGRKEWLENKLELLYKIHSSDKIGDFIEEIMDRARLL